jgi:hypothetical protein
MARKAKSRTNKGKKAKKAAQARTKMRAGQSKIIHVRLRTGNDGDRYALEKLVEAVDALVTGAGPVRARLFEAFTFLHRVHHACRWRGHRVAADRESAATVAAGDRLPQ